MVVLLISLCMVFIKISKLYIHPSFQLNQHLQKFLVYTNRFAKLGQINYPHKSCVMTAVNLWWIIKMQGLPRDRVKWWLSKFSRRQVDKCDYESVRKQKIWCFEPWRNLTKKMKCFVSTKRIFAEIFCVIAIKKFHSRISFYKINKSLYYIEDGIT